MLFAFGTKLTLSSCVFYYLLLIITNLFTFGFVNVYESIANKEMKSGKINRIDNIHKNKNLD